MTDEDTSLGFWGRVLSSKAPLTFTPPLGLALRISTAALPHEAKSSARASLVLQSAPARSSADPAAAENGGGAAIASAGAQSDAAASSLKAPAITVTSLTAVHHPSTPLDLYLLGGVEVTFTVKGDCDVHVSGYVTYQDDGGADDFDDLDEDDDDAFDGNLVHGHIQEDEDDDGEGGDGWLNPPQLSTRRRAAARKAVRSIIDELRDQRDEDDDRDDSDYVGPNGGFMDDDDDDEDDDEDDEDAVADAIRAQLKGKIRVIDSDEEEEEEEDDGEEPPQSAKVKAAAPTKKAAVVKGAPAAIAKSAGQQKAGAPAAAQPTPKKVNGVAASATTAAAPSSTPVTAAGGAKRKNGESTPVPGTPAAKKAKAGDEKTKVATPQSSSKGTVKCSGCDRTFASEQAMQQHATSKHK